MSYACKECGTVIMEDDMNLCKDCLPKYTEAKLKEELEIDCPDCGGRGWWYPLTEIGGSTRIICRNCTDGKITVYTEAELKQAVKEEREACALICEQKSNRESNGFFEKSIEMVTIICAEAIRARATK